jgi:hypothetical protein
VRSAILVVVFLVSALASAQATPPAARLAEAQRLFGHADYRAVAEIAGPLARDPSLDRADRTEAYRLFGLSLFLLAQPARAEGWLLQFLRLEPEAHLDPAVVPPDAIAFFEGIRARHEGELRALKPRPRRRRAWLNLVPPAGQFQNQEPAKGWSIGIAEGVLLATNISTYIVLINACDEHRTCTLGRDAANQLRMANLVSGALFVGVYAYGVLDGWLGHRNRIEDRAGLAITATGEGAAVTYSLGF